MSLCISTLLIFASQDQQSADGAHDLRSRKRNPSKLDDDHQPSSQPHRKKSRHSERTIDFDEVYQNGNPKYKHTIIEYPKESDKWYILRCDQHGVHFGARPLPGAIMHLNGKDHDQLPKDGALAIRQIGIRVQYCNAEKAKTNNVMFDQALAAGYRPFRASAREVGEEPEQVEQSASHDPRASTPPTQARQEKPEAFGGIMEPTVGEIYCVWYKPGRAYYAALMLPTGSFEPVGIAGDIAKTGLITYVPACYRKLEKKILGWTHDYEAGGCRVHRRKFPMMYLEDHLNVPLDGEFLIPKKNIFSWVRAKDMRPFDLDSSECQSVRGFRAAQAYCKRMEAINKDRARGESFGGIGLLLSLTVKPVPYCDADNSATLSESENRSCVWQSSTQWV